VLICDDRCDVRHELLWALQSDSRDSVQEVPDGDSLLDAYEEGTINQVLIGVHSGTTVGTHAIELLLATHPDAAPIVIGSIKDIDLLTGATPAALAVYCCGNPQRRPPTRCTMTASTQSGRPSNHRFVNGP